MSSELSAGFGHVRRAAWPPGLSVRLWEAGILLAEAMMVLASGAITRAIIMSPGADLPNPWAMAATYVFLLVAADAVARPPGRRRRGAALRILAAVFLGALLLSGHIVAGAPALALWALIAASAISAWRWLALRLAQKMPRETWPARPIAFIGNSEAAVRLLNE